MAVAIAIAETGIVGVGGCKDLSMNVRAEGGMTLRQIVLTIGLVLVLQAPTSLMSKPVQSGSEPNANQIMRSVVETYQSLSTYSDRGTTIVHSSDSDAVYRVEFESLFKRPRRLRFAWTMEFSHVPGHKQTGVIWCDGEIAWASYSFLGGKPERKKTLESAEAGATGASQGTAHTILRLLSEEVGGMRLDELQALTITGSEMADGIKCTVLLGYFASGEQRTIWVGSNDHLIRRIEDRYNTSRREEVHTQIVVNQDIADSRFSEHGR